MEYIYRVLTLCVYSYFVDCKVMNFKTALFSLLLLTISMHLLDAADCKTSLPIAQAHIGACVIRECKQNEKCICDIQNGLCHQYCSANYCPLIKCTAPQGCEQNSRINTIKTLEADSDIVKQVNTYVSLLLLVVSCRRISFAIIADEFVINTCKIG